MFNKKLAVIALLLVVIGLFAFGSFLVTPKYQTSFCDSASIEEGSDFPPTCYEAPQSWKEEGKLYAIEKLEVKK